MLACPDPPGADDCMRLVRMLAEQDEKEGIQERPVIMFNQRLSRWAARAAALLHGCAHVWRPAA